MTDSKASKCQSYLIDPIVQQRRQIDLGEFFKQRRLSAGIDESQAASELGLTTTQEIIEMEGGHRPFALDDMFILANVYNIDPDEVLRLFARIFFKGNP